MAERAPGGGTRRLLAWTALALFGPALLEGASRLLAVAAFYPGLGPAEAPAEVLIPAAREALARERRGPPGLE